MGLLDPLKGNSINTKKFKKIVYFRVYDNRKGKALHMGAKVGCPHTFGYIAYKNVKQIMLQILNTNEQRR